MSEAAVATVPTVVGASADGRDLTVTFGDGTSARYNRFWLRDNCPSNGDRASLFRPFTVAGMSDDLTLHHVEPGPGGVLVTFSDGTTDLIPVELLHRHRPVSSDPTAPTAPAETGQDVVHDVAYGTVVADERRRFELLDAVCRRGFALVTGVPGADATETMAAWLGPIRETDFGRVFDIVSEPDPFTPSQSVAALDPHTDDPYRYSPAGISILHCVEQCSGDGGATTIVDGFAIAETLATDDPDAFRLLASVPVPYVHRRERSAEQGAAVDLRASAPVISCDAEGAVCGVRFHERSMAPLRLDADTTEQFYRALMAFSRHVRSERFAYRRRLSPGDAVVYDNQRVLHGRTAITGAESRRHLRLCTVDRDQVHSRLRQLWERHSSDTACPPLPAGSSW